MLKWPFKVDLTVLLVKIPSWSKRQRCTVLSVIFIVVLWSVYRLHFADLFTQLQQQKKFTQHLQQTVKSQQQQLQTSQRLMIRPLTILDNVTLLAVTTQALHQSGLVVHELQTLNNLVNVTAQGSYAQFLKFCQLIADHQQGLTIQNLQLKNVLNTKDLAIRLFVKNKVILEKSVKPATSVFSENKLSNPFLPNSVSLIAASPLLRYPLASLHYLGLLRNTDCTWGLVAAKDGDVYPIRIGDYLSSQNFKVIIIDKTILQLLDPKNSNQLIEMKL